MVVDTVNGKLELLADQCGSSIGELLEEYGVASVVPGICMNPGCDYTADCEPDQREGWCGECDTPSVKSLLVLHEVI